MNKRLIPLVVALLTGVSLTTFAEPPPKKKKKPDAPAPAPAPVVPVPVPTPVPVKPAPVPVKPTPKVVVPVPVPVPVKPKPAPVVATRFCGVERPHAPHNFTGRGGVIVHCPGKVAGPGPKGPPRRP